MSEFQFLRAANSARQTEWTGDVRVGLAFRGVELAGETGEACNIIKKLERERLGFVGSRGTVEQLADELADVVICADLAAMDAGIDLQAAIVRKFNATSEKVGLATRMAEADNAQRLRDEVTFWRQDAAARLSIALTLAKAAERDGDEQRGADIRVSILLPTRSALRSALNGDLHWPLCEGCGEAIEAGDVVFTYESGEVTHVDCGDRQGPVGTPESTVHAEDPEFTPDGIAATLTKVTAYLDGADGQAADHG